MTGFYLTPMHQKLIDNQPETAENQLELIPAGRWGYSHPTFPSGTWYIRMENDTVTGDACITGGTITVTRNGEEYDIAFDFTSDAGYKVTGSFKGALDIRTQ